MSDSKRWLRAPLRPGSMGMGQEERGKFPFDAFEFEDPGRVATPVLRVKSPWILEADALDLHTSQINLRLPYTEAQQGYTQGGGTKTPTVPTITLCKSSSYRAIKIGWNRQLNLTNLDHYEIQVCADSGGSPDGNWYSPRFDGVDWKDTLGADYDWPFESVIHTLIPFGGTTDNPTAVTLHYRVRRALKAGDPGGWSAAASATVSPIVTGDVTAGAITTAKLGDGQITQVKMASGLRVPVIVGSLPSLPDAAFPQGAVVVLTTDNKLYRSTGTSWTAVVPTGDLSGTISEAQIAAGAVSSTKLAAGAVIAGKIAAGAIVAADIAADAILAGNIAAGAIGASELAAGAVVAGKIAANAVNAGTIAAGVVDTDQLAASAVTADKIAANTITANKLYTADIATMLLLATSAVIVGQDYVGSPPHGAQRVVVDDNEFKLVEYDGRVPYDEAGWQTVLRLGGDDVLKWYLQCRGLIKPGADISGIEIGFIAPAAGKIYRFEDDCKDQDGVDPWTKANIGYATGKWKKALTYSGVGSSASIYTTGSILTGGQSFGIGFWFKTTNIGLSTLRELVYFYGGGNDKITISQYEDDIKLSVKKNGTETVYTISACLTAAEWHFISFSYDAGSNYASVRVDGATTGGNPGGTWAGDSLKLYVQIYDSGYNVIFSYDDLMVLLNSYYSATQFQDYYQANQPWVDPDTGVDYAKDLINVAKSGGKIFTFNQLDAVAGLDLPTLHVRDEKASGTDGGDFNSGAWRTRTLNAVKKNTIIGASLSSNQITLPAGTYHVQFSASGRQVGQHKAKFYNISDSADVIIGTSEYAAGSSVQTGSFGSGEFTIAATKVFELQHYAGTTMLVSGFGLNCGVGVIEVYAEVIIRKVG